MSTRSVRSFASALAATHSHQLCTMLLILLMANLNGEIEAATANTNHENNVRQADVEPRQFGGGFNANAAFNSNFGSSNFGVNLGSGNNGGPSGGSFTGGVSLPTTPPLTTTAFNANTKPNSINNFNSYNNNNSNNKNKDTNKNTYNDYNQKHPGTRVLDNFNHRYPDGSYEYRYELADGTARYERGYFLLYDNKKTLVVVGYYSYRMPDGRYITVFYNADQNGYRQNQSITPQNYPNLPRSIDVPETHFKDSESDLYSRTTTTPYPRLTTTTRRGGRF